MRRGSPEGRELGDPGLDSSAGLEQREDLVRSRDGDGSAVKVFGDPDGHDARSAGATGTDRYDSGINQLFDGGAHSGSRNVHLMTKRIE